MVYALKKLENLKNGVYPICFGRNNLSQLKNTGRGLLASVLPAVTQVYTVLDYITWFINGYLWNLPEFILRYGQRRLLDNFPSVLTSTIQEYATNMSAAQMIIGFIGWVCFWITVWGIKRAAKPPKE